jgi:hypothetical protein|uniref:hypothetical protein n=2 Tax=Polynucleobacter sp. TaxID=2029855 RepID=UPI0040480AD2
MMKKISDLEQKLDGLKVQEVLEQRIVELEGYVHDLQNQKEVAVESLFTRMLLIFQTLVLPLCVLLISHALITIVYDFELIYLRVISILVPLPFAYHLFQKKKRLILPWVAGTILLACSAVIGMSAITAYVDHTPIMPKNPIEWREFFEYSASISFSFFTGMLLGTLSFMRRMRTFRKQATNAWVQALVSGFADGKLSPEALQKIMHKVNEFGGTAVALGTTAISIYAGLKGVLGE